MHEPIWNRDDPLARCKHETRRANDALRAYFLMGSGRSLDKLLERFRVQLETEPSTKPPSLRRATLADWSSKFDWQARVDRAKELDDEAQQKEWEQRRREWKQEEWDVAHELLEKARLMLQFPPGETVHEREDGSLVIVKPAKWRASDIARYAETASKLVRLAAEMETERARQEITGEGGGPVQVEDVHETRRRLLADLEREVEDSGPGAAEGVG